MSIVRFAMMTALAVLPGLADSAADAAQQWTMKGKLEVEHLLPELVAMNGERSGLPSAQVHLWARSKEPQGWGSWQHVDKVVASADGEFAFADDSQSELRQFKIGLVFDSDRLRFESGDENADESFAVGDQPTQFDITFAEARMFEVYNDAERSDSDGWQPGVVDVGDIVLADGVAREFADLWVLYGQVFDLLAGYGEGYALQDKIALNYPMALETVSYANAEAGRILLNAGDFDARTAMHAFFHIYLHQMIGGDEAMAWQSTDGGHATRWRDKTTSTAHQAAFAEWAAHKALLEMSDAKLENFIGSMVYAFPHNPLSRHQIDSVLPLTEQTIAHVDYTAAGWHSLFNILTYENVDALNFNAPMQIVDDENRLRTFGWYAHPQAGGACPEQRFAFEFRDVLALHVGDDGLDADAMSFNAFFDRATKRLEGFGPEEVERIKVYLSPNETKHPCKAAF